jgi:hypothetical protein
MVLKLGIASCLDFDTALDFKADFSRKKSGLWKPFLLPCVKRVRIMLPHMNKAASWIETPSGIVNVPLSPELMLHAARGFLLLFWSITATALLARGVVQIPLTAEIQLPSYVIGLCIAYLGIVFLRKGGALTPRWLKRSRDAMALLLILVYLAPFSRWWIRSPQSGYYTVNMLAIVLVGAWLFYTLNMLAAEWARVVHNNEFRVECELAAWTAVITALLPTLTVLATAMTAWAAAAPWSLLNGGLNAPWLRRLEFLFPYPFIVTALVMWNARRLALRRCTTTPPRMDQTGHEKSS